MSAIRDRHSASDMLRQGYRGALGLGLLASMIAHGALLLLGSVSMPAPQYLNRATTLVVLPEPEPSPPTVDVPEAPAPLSRPASPVAVEAPVEEETERGPRFIPHDVAPKLVNSSDIQDYLRLFYPQALQLAGVEGAVRLWLFVDQTGEPVKLQVKASSGVPEFDELAKSAASFMRFRPALSHGRSVGVWVSLWVRFDVERDYTRGRLADASED